MYWGTFGIGDGFKKKIFKFIQITVKMYNIFLITSQKTLLLCHLAVVVVVAILYLFAEPGKINCMENKTTLKNNESKVCHFHHHQAR